MPARANDNDNRNAVAPQLRLLAASADNRRRLQAMPQLRAETRLPREMRDLLERLDQADR